MGTGLDPHRPGRSISRRVGAYIYHIPASARGYEQRGSDGTERRRAERRYHGGEVLRTGRLSGTRHRLRAPYRTRRVGRRPPGRPGPGGGRTRRHRFPPEVRRGVLVGRRRDDRLRADVRGGRGVHHGLRTPGERDGGPRELPDRTRTRGCGTAAPGGRTRGNRRIPRPLRSVGRRLRVRRHRGGPRRRGRRGHRQ
jgi:hypothetical protein